MALFGLNIALLATPWGLSILSHLVRERNIFWKPHHSLSNAIRSYLWIIAILGFAIKAYSLEEKSWIANDPLGTPSGIFHTKLEEISYETLRKETLDLLEPTRSSTSE